MSIDAPPAIDVVTRYYRVAGDLGSTEAELAELLHEDAQIVEHPNAITPTGATRTRDDTLAAYRASRGLLRDQEFVIQEVMERDGRVAVRARWRATIGVSRGALAAGDQLEAYIASFLTVVDGRIRDQETYDCYPPLP